MEGQVQFTYHFSKLSNIRQNLGKLLLCYLNAGDFYSSLAPLLRIVIFLISLVSVMLERMEWDYIETQLTKKKIRQISILKSIII